MIHVIQMHLEKFMNEHKNYMKRKNVIGVRIVLVILKAMHLRNMHSKNCFLFNKIYEFVC